MILNEEMEWGQIKMQDRDAFRKNPPPEKVLIEPGAMLCRFITTESKKRNIRGNQTFNSPWWMDWNVTVRMLMRWRGKAPVQEIIRAMLAVPEQFSQELDSLVQIVLKGPVYAWKGAARHQHDPARRVTYLGGGEQFYLPNLPSDSAGLSSDVAYLHCFTSIDSII